MFNFFLSLFQKGKKKGVRLENLCGDGKFDEKKIPDRRIYRVLKKICEEGKYVQGKKRIYRDGKEFWGEDKDNPEEIFLLETLEDLIEFLSN